MVYDFSTNIQLHISDERDAVVTTLGVPFAQIADNKGLAYTGSFTDGGINIEATLGRGDAIVEINAIEPDIRSAAALMHYKNDAFIVDGRNVEKFQWKRITVLPATNVHYEESFVTFENGISGASWSDEGRPVNAYQSAENRSYGFDASYGNYSQDSNGISKTVTVGKSQFGNTANFPTATFTFTGTGFDIMGRAGFNSGVYFVRILRNGSLVKSQIINTRYFGSGEGDEGAAVLYQVPVVSIGDLEYGEYTVETKFLWTPGYATRGENSTVIYKGEEYEYIALFDAPTTKGSTDELPSFDIYFDAVRIYNPTAPGNAVAKNAYTEAIEANPNYVELRKYLNEHNSDLTGGASANGAIAIDVPPHQVPKLDDNGKPVIGDDGKPVYEFVMPQGDEPFTMTDYMNFGPNNEMYIKNGNALGFKVNTSTLASLQISAKSPFGASSDTNLKVQVASVSGGKDYTKSVSISSATEMFYDFSDLLAQTGIAGKEIYVVISAQGSGILSLCKLKLVSNDDIKAQISSDMDTVEYACAATAGTKGDVNADTTVDMLDALLSMRAALCAEALGVYGTYCADMNNDGFADVEDALNIIRTALEN